MKIRNLPRLHATILPLLLAASGAAGCDTTAPVVPEPSFVGTWAGHSWKGDANALLSAGTDTLHIIGSSPAGHPIVHEMVSIRVLFDGIGVYTLGPGSAQLVGLHGGDVVNSTYAVPAANSGTLVIEEFTASRVRGHVIFLAEALGLPSPYGPQASFNGSFDAPVQHVF